MPENAMPAAFFGHGSPMNALELNRYTAAWKAFGQEMARPRALLVISAHWYMNATAVTAMPRPRTIHDFYGFPQELFDVEYPAPGLPELPTPDHFISWLYFAGLTSVATEKASVLIDGYTFGSMSMTAYTLGSAGAYPREDTSDALQAAPGVPAEASNI